MHATVGLQIAIDEGCDLVADCEASRAARQIEHGAGIRLQLIGLDAVVEDPHLRSIFGGMLARLPSGRRDHDVGIVHSHQDRGVARAQFEALGQPASEGKLRIEHDVGPVRRIIEFRIGDEPSLREDFARKQGFAPSDLADDDLRRKSLRLQRRHPLRGRLPALDAQPKRDRHGIGAALHDGLEGIARGHDKIGVAIVLVGHRRHAHPRRRRERAREGPELGRKVLVQEKDVHFDSDS